MRVPMLFGVLLAAGCTGVPERHELKQSIDAAVRAGNGTRVSFPELTDFAWDEVCIANPSARGPLLSQQLGFQWRGRGAGVSNEQQLLIFVEVREPRSESRASGQLSVRGDNWLVDATGCIPRDSAVFIAEARGGVYSLVPITRVAIAQPLAPDSLPRPVAQAPSSILFPLDSFPRLPANVRQSLAGCLIPQTYVGKEPHNVISGQFAAAGQPDWAVLCSRNDTSSIVVVWGGAARCPSPFRPGADKDWGAPLAYDRYIALATMQDILRHKEYYDGPDPPARDHDGIHDGYNAKASIIFFCHQGKWHELQGAD